jgi:hypothetical protein
MLHCHVTITLEWFVLKWFGFSGEGLLFSKDSAGAVRTYLLQTSEWNHLHLENPSAASTGRQ